MQKPVTIAAIATYTYTYIIINLLIMQLRDIAEHKISTHLCSYIYLQCCFLFSILLVVVYALRMFFDSIWLLCRGI